MTHLANCDYSRSGPKVLVGCMTALPRAFCFSNLGTLSVNESASIWDADVCGPTHFSPQRPFAAGVLRVLFTGKLEKRVCGLGQRVMAPG